MITVAQLALHAIPGAAAGLIAGVIYFAMVRRSADLFAAGRAGSAVALQAARFGALALCLYGLARGGALSLLGAGAGLYVARLLAVRAPEGGR